VKTHPDQLIGIGKIIEKHNIEVLMPKVRKKYSDCGHSGFGAICRRCNPWPERKPEEQLKRLDNLGLTATKERNKLALKIKKAAKNASKNSGTKTKQEKAGSMGSPGSKRKGPRTKRRTKLQNSKFSSGKKKKQIF
jgi:hypothetical protein